jgi:hypothetical protein
MTAFAFDLMISLVDHFRYFVFVLLSSSHEVVARVRAYHDEGSIAAPTDCHEWAIEAVYRRLQGPAHGGVLRGFFFRGQNMTVCFLGRWSSRKGLP